MQKLLSLVLSVSILCSSITPAWSQARALGRGVQGRRVPPVVNRGGTSVLSSGVTRRVYTQMAFANSTVQTWVKAGQVTGLAHEMFTRPVAEQRAFLHRDFVSLSLLPHAVSVAERAQAGVLLGNQVSQHAQVFKEIPQADLSAFLTDYKNHPSQPGFTSVQDLLADASALAQVGAREQATVLLTFYKQAKGTIFEDTATLITARGLLRMREYESLSLFLVQVKDKAILAGTVAYIKMNNLPIEVPAELIQCPIPAANEELAAFLSVPFVLNHFHADPSVEATRDWLHLQQQVPAVQESTLPAKTASLQAAHTAPAEIVLAEETVQPTVTPQADVSSAPVFVQPVTPTVVPDVATTSAVSNTTTPVSRPTSSHEGIVYSGIPVFAIIDASQRALNWVRQKLSRKQQKKAPYEEPGLHESNVRPVLAQVEVPSKAAVGGDLVGVDNEIQEVTVGVDGFKLTVEGPDKVEHILQNVDLTVSADLKNFSPEYNRLTLDTNHIFELRNQTVPAKRPDHFFFALSIQNGEFEALINGTNALRLSRPMRIKIQKTGSPKKSITLPVYDAQLHETLLVAEVDTSLLSGIKHPEQGAIWYDGKTLLFHEKQGVVTSLENAFVRLPKAESKYWTQILKMYPQTPFHLTVLSTKGKMVPVTYLVPSLQVGLGKTLAPELNARSTLSEEEASNVMLGINNVLPTLIGFVHPILKRYGEAAVFRVGAAMFSAGGLIALASGLYGHLGSVMTSWQLTGFLTSSVLIALGTNITRFVQNLLMSANRGIVPQANSFQKIDAVAQAKPVVYNMNHLAQRAWEVLTKKSSKSLRDVVYYQKGAMFKNLGTMLFLSFPSLANLAGKAVGYDLGLDFSASYVPYTLYSLYVLRKVYKTRYKDAFPLNKTVLSNNLQDLQNSTAVKISEVAPADLTAAHPVLMNAAKQLKGAIDALAPVEARQLKTGINGLTLKHEAEVGEELENLLLLANRTPQEAQAARTALQQAFDVLSERNVRWYQKWWRTFKMKGLPTALAAMTLATFGELGLSNGLAFAMREILGKDNATAATGVVGLLLYGCMFGWRVVGNFISQRMSGGSMYAVSSVAGVAGPVLMALAMQSGNMGLLVGGAITACFGISNFFSQMYEYMVGLHPKYKREIALLINYTMPLAALPVGIMKSDWFKGFGIPGLDMALCGAALAASVILTPKMLANSSFVRMIETWWEKMKNKTGGDPLPPPAQASAQ